MATPPCTYDLDDLFTSTKSSTIHPPYLVDLMIKSVKIRFHWFGSGRRAFEGSTSSLRWREAVLEVNIKPGWKAGTKASGERGACSAWSVFFRVTVPLTHPPFSANLVRRSFGMFSVGSGCLERKHGTD